MTKEQRQNQLDINLTFIVELSEVMTRIVTEDIDNPALKFILKKEFNGLFAQCKKVDKEFRKYIKQDKRYDDPEELFDTGADHMYNLIKSTYGIKSGAGWEEAIVLIKSLAKREEG